LKHYSDKSSIGVSAPPWSGGFDGRRCRRGAVLALGALEGVAHEGVGDQWDRAKLFQIRAAALARRLLRRGGAGHKRPSSARKAAGVSSWPEACLGRMIT
jgi:hypothetical protein